MQNSNYMTNLMNDFTKLYERYYERVFRYICYRVNEYHIAEELCSEVFERMIKKYHTFSGHDNALDSWVFTIAKNTITDYYRKKNRLFHFSLDHASNLQSGKLSPDEIIVTKENHVYLFEALKKLSDKERSIISLKYGAGLKSNEIACIMGLTESNVNVIIYRCLRKLKKILIQNGGFKYERE